ncbi:MAG: TonB-dependent receptor, partial [Calditrichia bacterium]|nr:TonB-dependent receptor [Calditrichia bacterium]
MFKIKDTNYYHFMFLLIIVLLFPATLIAQEPSIDELLELNIQELLDIEVTSVSKAPQKIGEAPATVRVITSEQIRLHGYMTLEEALSDLPGFQFRNILGLNSYVFQRGAQSQNNLILLLIDGIQINELNSGGFYGGGQYNLFNVEKIEVVYGPASALYGTNAVSGIINIITKSPMENQGLTLSALYGSFNTISTDANYGYFNEDNDLGFCLSAMYKTSEKADLKGEKGDNNWTDNMDNFEDDYSIDAKLSYKNFSAGINFLNKQSSAATYFRSRGTIYHDHGTLWNIRFINAWLKHQFQLSSKWLISPKLYFRDATVLDNSIQKVTDTMQIGYYRPNNQLGMEILVNYNPDEKLNVTGGMLFESERLAKGYSNTYSSSVSEKPSPPSAPPMQSNTLYSAYFQAQNYFVKSFSIAAGLRYDYSSVYDQVLTPRVALIFGRNKFTVKALYMEAFRAPKPWDYYDGLGNPSLKPEKMRSFELSTTFALTNQIRLELLLYKNLIYKRLTEEFIGNDRRWINKGKLYVNGLETVIEYRIKKINAY